ncbi:MAG: helix-turn-helix domain-containing protein [Blautia sp.]|nr:helix-turn-helix domain-containing protein [Blautia sp.]
MRPDLSIDKYLIRIIDNMFDAKRILSDPELFFMFEGSMELVVSGKKYTMKPDDIIVVNADRECSVRIAPGSLLCSIRIPLSVFEEGSDTVHTLIWCNTVSDENENYGSLRLAIRRLLYQYVQLGSAPGSLGFLSSFYSLLENIQLNFTLTQYNSGLEKDKNAERMDKISRYINANYNEAITLKEMAGSLYLSSAYLSRYIKKEWGVTFEEYLRKVRAAHALDDLLYTDHTITRIAVDNGFSNTALLNRAFKAVYGINPSEYRRSVTKDIPDAGDAREGSLEERLVNYLQQNSANEVSDQQIPAEADADKFSTYQKNWNKIINISSASELLDAGIQEHVLLLRSKLDFDYVRIWNLFSEKLLVQTNAGDGRYYFRKIDQILDFLVEHNITPFLDLGMEPKVVLGSLQRRVYQDGNTHSGYEGFDLCQWESLLEEFIKHILRRYGREEVQKWKYELWDGSQGNEQTEEMLVYYLNLFSKSHHVFRKLLPGAAFGGCGSTGLFNRKMFCRLLELWDRHAPLPDFFSVKIFAYIKEDDVNDAYASRSTDPLFLVHSLREIRRVMKKYSFEGPELYVTEWNQTLSSRNFINDSCYRGAMNLQSLITSIGEADSLSYFYGSDRQSEFTDAEEILHGGLGLLTKDSIIKPAGYAFVFANKLFNRCLGRTNSYMITSDGYGNYSIVCHNSRKLNYYYYMTDEMDISREKLGLYFEDMERIRYDYRIHNVENGLYQVRIYQVNENAGSILDLWKENDFFVSTSKQPVNYYRSTVHPKVSFRNISTENRCLELSLDMLPNEIALIRIEKSI